MTKLSHAAILKQGRYSELCIDGVDPDLLRRLYSFMQRLRIVEQRLIDEYHPADEIRCPVHFCIGQEAMSAALHEVLREDDSLFSHHRSHGYYLAKKAPLDALFAELYGKATGANGGKAGSQDISKHSHRFYAGAILSGAVGIATGAALAAKLDGSQAVAVSGFGEGATDEGIFWEAINFATLHELPVVFLCENNGYATFSPQFKRSSRDNLSQRVDAFGMHTITLFGNDVVKARDAVAEAIGRAREGQGPTFIEAYTYRWNGHVGPESDDHQDYRPMDELEFWKANCPIALVEERLLEHAVISADDKIALIASINAEIDQAFAFAKSSEFPDIPDWHALNNATATPLADELLEEPEASSSFDQNQVFAVPAPY